MVVLAASPLSWSSGRGSEVHAGWRFCREVGVKGPGGAWPREGGEIVTLEGGKLVPGEAAGPVSLEGE